VDPTVLKFDCLIDSLLGLYDACNDDDEVIRMIAAQVMVYQPDELALAPLEARTRIMNRFQYSYTKEPKFMWSMLIRLTCDDFADETSIEELLHKAFAFKEDTLFVVEDNNLYEDKVAEMRYWSEIFLKLPVEVLQDRCLPDDIPDDIGSPIDFLKNWVLEAFQIVHDTVQAETAVPLGFASKRAFAACVRILYCATTVVAHFIRTAGPVEHFDEEELNRWKSEHGLHGVIKGIEEFAAMDLHEALFSLFLSAESLKLTRLDILSCQISDMRSQGRVKFPSIKAATRSATANFQDNSTRLTHENLREILCASAFWIS
jgi:hypothetical protein